MKQSYNAKALVTVSVTAPDLSNDVLPKPHFVLYSIYSDEGQLIVSQRNGPIMVYFTNLTMSHVLTVETPLYPARLAYHYRRQRIFWTDVKSPKLFSAYVNGTDQKPVSYIHECEEKVGFRKTKHLVLVLRFLHVNHKRNSYLQNEIKKS